MKNENKHYCYNHHELVAASDRTTHTEMGCDIDKHSQAYYELVEMKEPQFDCARGFRAMGLMIMVALALATSACSHKNSVTGTGSDKDYCAEKPSNCALQASQVQP